MTPDDPCFTADEQYGCLNGYQYVIRMGRLMDGRALQHFSFLQSTIAQIQLHFAVSMLVLHPSIRHHGVLPGLAVQLGDGKLVNDVGAWGGGAWQRQLGLVGPDF